MPFATKGPTKRGEEEFRCTSFGKAFRKGCDAICENGSDPSPWSIKDGLLSESLKKEHACKLAADQAPQNPNLRHSNKASRTIEAPKQPH